MRKRIGLYLALGCFSLAALLLLATPGMPQTGTNVLTAAQLQARAWTFALRQHFTSGLDVVGGQTIGLEGSAGDTYLKRDADTASLDTYKDGTLTTQQRTNEWIAPDCDSDGPDTFGGFCKQAADGKVYYRDAGGVKALP